MMGFTFIPDDPDGEASGVLGTGKAKCDKCGEIMPTGIIGLSEHWSKCSADEANAIMSWAEGMMKTKGKLTVEDFEREFKK